MGKIYDYLGNIVIPDSGLEDLDDLLPNRLLIWHDEFKNSELDSSKWRMIQGKVNNQYESHSGYTKNQKLVVNLNDNGLTYRAIKDNAFDDVSYTCPFLMTKDKFEFQYGRIEAKIKFPNSTAHHSTLWTLGACSDRADGETESVQQVSVGVAFPSNGEIDIAEFDNNSVGARMHWSSDGFDTSVYASGGNIDSLVATPNEWHIYAAEWTSSSIDFYVDGVKKGTWATSSANVGGWNPFHHPHYLILNCIAATSGTINWDVMETKVAWVRVYAPVGVTTYIKETGISIDASASISVGERKWLEPTFTPAIPSDMTIVWISHNENIVTCYGGMLVGISSGTTFVQCTTKHGYTALCKVTVT